MLAHKQNFPAQMDCLYQMLEFVERHVLVRGFDLTTLSKIILALEEALVNIINYGYPDKAGTIEIICDDCEEKAGIKIILMDHGIPFNPIKQPKPGPVHHDSPSGGFGIHIFVGIMDHVEYQQIDGGNTLSLIKYL